MLSKLKFLSVSWPQLHQVCFTLAQKIIKRKLSFDRIVCISRGGLLASRLFSDLLELPISNFTMVSYPVIGQAKKPKIVEKLAVSIKGESILLIDEIIDSGGSLELAVSYLEKLAPKKITTLIPYIKPSSKITPDFWQVKTSAWVVFPYEVRETVNDLKKLAKKEDMPQKKLLELLAGLKLEKKQVEYFLES